MIILLIKTNKYYSLNNFRGFKKFFRGIDCNWSRLVLWETINPSADIRKGNSFNVVLHCQFEAVEIGKCKKPFFIIPAIIPDRAYGMNNKFCRKVSGCGNDGFTNLATALPVSYLQAIFQNRLSSRAMNRSIHTSATQ